jgi:hypothetical protein
MHGCSYENDTPTMTSSSSSSSSSSNSNSNDHDDYGDTSLPATSRQRTQAHTHT